MIIGLGFDVRSVGWRAEDCESDVVGGCLMMRYGCWRLG